MALGIISKAKEKVEEMKKDIHIGKFAKNFYGFISLNNGAGTKTIAVNTAIELAKEYKVCLLDCNFFQPGICHTLNSQVYEDDSISKYLNSSVEKEKVFKPITGFQNIWLVGASPLDFPLNFDKINEGTYKELLNYIKESFDYVIAYMPYHPLAESFIYTLEYVDKGYIVWDDQVDCGTKTKFLLDYVNVISKKANCINNVILNKLPKRDYSVNLVKNVECNLVVTFPFNNNIPLSKNEGKVFNAKNIGDKSYVDNTKLLMNDIKSGQRNLVL